MASLFDDYLRTEPALTPFFAGVPGDVSKATSGGPWAPGLAEELQEYQSALGLERSFRGDEAVIATGQQPAIFTGPLYTVYKAVTAVKLAARVEERTGAPAVPVFWVGADDHDFEEARTAHFLTKQHEHLALTYTPPEDVTGRPMYTVPAAGELHGLIDEAAAAVPGSEWREPVAEFLHAALDESTSLADWFARLLARLFRDTPLVVHTTTLDASRRGAAEVIAAEIRAPGASTERVQEAGKQLEAAGYSAQVDRAADQCNFFLEVDRQRCRVFFRDGRFEVAETGDIYSEAELLALLEERPDRFTPNVILRPVVQQALFPVAAYAGGPGEVAYWGQLKEVFAQFGHTMPIVYPRARAVLSTIKLNKLLAKYDLKPDDLLQPREALEQQALRAVNRHPGLEIVTRYRQQFEEQAAALGRELAEAEPKDRAPRDLAVGLGEQIATGLDRIERALLHQNQAQQEAAQNHIARLCTALAPDRKPQERVYTIFSFLFEHGWDLVPRLIDELDVESFALNEVEL